MNVFTLLKSTILFLTIPLLNDLTHAQEHIETADEHTSGTQEIVLSDKQIKLAGIKILTVEKKMMSTSLYAPGEIITNGYTSYYVSPRIESIILKRHVKLGDEVQAGQALVTLFSEAVAQAQANYRIAHAEWQRIQALTSEVISQKAKLATETEFIAATSQLKAYGLSNNAIILITQDSSSALGEYTLTAQRAGSVLSDDFHLGQRINAGDTIIILADENQLWIEAKLPASESTILKKGTTARLSIGNKIYNANVIQAAHSIDAQTRTRIIRLIVDNSQHQLHPGMFVDVSFLLKTSHPVIALPQSALTRSNDGDWQVFIETINNEFSAIEVELGAVLQNENDQEMKSWQAVTGLTQGQNVVVEGAFFIAAQAAKSSFDIHNH
jgi:RND family efflux transporter MFP subunit